MANNQGLTRANKAKKDEFYTRYEDIQAEINHYESHFKGKTVLCNCDDPFESNFCKFFLKNFNYLQIKRLICTSFATSPMVGKQLSIFDEDNEPVVADHGYVMDICEIPMANNRGVSDEDIYTLLKSQKSGVKRLKGNGDFRSDECISYLKQADIVVTNPPFSLFREYVAQLVKYSKSYLIIGNVNAVTYKEIFPLIKDNKMWLGASIHSGDRKFYVPDSYPLEASGCGVDEAGRHYIKVKGVRWFTNLDYKKRHEELVLFKRYYGNENDYPKYDNYDAINVDKTSDIPCDYFENIGVPITFIDRYNPSQFEIVDANDISCNGIKRKPHGLIKDKEASISSRCSQIVNVERERERERERTSRGELMRELSSGERCNGIMGVPITFLDKYNPHQFEILGLDRYIDDNPRFGRRFTIDGKETYARVLIKHRL